MILPVPVAMIVSISLQTDIYSVIYNHFFLVCCIDSEDDYGFDDEDDEDDSSVYEIKEENESEGESETEAVVASKAMAVSDEVVPASEGSSRSKLKDRRKAEAVAVGTEEGFTLSTGMRVKSGGNRDR